MPTEENRYACTCCGVDHSGRPLRRFMAILAMWLDDALGRITSAYRCEKWEVEVQAKWGNIITEEQARRRPHVRGDAVDLHAPDMVTASIIIAAALLCPEVCKLGLHLHSDRGKRFVHVQFGRRKWFGVEFYTYP